MSEPTERCPDCNAFGGPTDPDCGTCEGNGWVCPDCRWWPCECDNYDDRDDYEEDWLYEDEDDE